MVDLVDSVFAGSLDLYDMAMDFDDLAFLNLIVCMEEADQALGARLQEIRTLNDQKRALNQRIAELNEALAKADGEFVMIQGGLEDCDSVSAKMASRFSNVDWSAQNPVDFFDGPQEPEEAWLPYSKEEVQAEIERLRGELEDLNTSSSIMLVDLNRLMGKRQEAVQLTSNILTKSHETAMNLISNIGR